MTRFIRLFIGLLVFPISIVIAGDLPPLQMKADKLMRAAHLLSPAEMEAILGSERAEVLDLVRRVARSEVTEWVDRSQLSPAEARRVLLRLPDPEVLESIGNLLAEHQFISPYGSVVDALFGALDSKQPKLLPYIARGVFRNEDADTRDFEWASPGKINRSMESLSCMLRLTYVMEEFSPEVRAWARAMLKSHFLPANERRELGRTWWKANEKAIIAGNYAAVRAGISPAQGMPAAPVSTLPEPGDAKRVSPNASPTTSTNSSNGSPVLGLPTVTEGTAPRPLLWLILGGITAVLAGMAVWLGMRSRGRKE